MVSVIDQETVGTTTFVPTLSVSLNIGSSGNVVAYVVVIGTMAGGVSSNGGQGVNWQRRATIGGPVTIDIWWAFIPFPGSPINVTVTPLGGATTWAFGAYSFAGALPGLPFDQSAMPGAAITGGGNGTFCPYHASLPGDLVLTVVSNSSGLVESGVGAWTPMLTISAGAIVAQPFMLGLLNAQSGQFIGMQNGTATWVAFADIFATIPAMTVGMSTSVPCTSGPAAPLTLAAPPAPVAVANPGALPPANNFQRCKGVYTTPSGASAPGP